MGNPYDKEFKPSISKRRKRYDWVSQSAAHKPEQLAAELSRHMTKEQLVQMASYLSNAVEGTSIRGYWQTLAGFTKNKL